MNSNEFISKIGTLAKLDQKKSGILASLTIAQAILESNWGNSGLTVKANNLFGIKGTYNGQSITMPAVEYYRGVRTTVNAVFRKYPSWVESLADHSSLFLRLERYKNLRGETDYKTACKNVQADGYATDPSYANKLIGLIDLHNLTRYDYIAEDAALVKAVDKLVGAGANINPSAWNDLSKMNLRYAQSLIEKVGAIFGATDYFTAIDIFVRIGVIGQRKIWDEKQFKNEYIRSLLIKAASKL